MDVDGGQERAGRDALGVLARVLVGAGAVVVVALLVRPPADGLPEVGPVVTTETPAPSEGTSEVARPTPSATAEPSPTETGVEGVIGDEVVGDVPAIDAFLRRLSGRWDVLGEAGTTITGDPVGTWTGRWMVVGFHPDTRAYRPGAGWTTLPDHPNGPSPERVVTAVSADEVVVLDPPSGTCHGESAGVPICARGDHRLWSLDLVERMWTALPDPPPDLGWPAVVVATDTHLVVWGAGGTGSAVGNAGAVLERSSRSWHPLPEVLATGDRPQGLAAGTRIVPAHVQGIRHADQVLVYGGLATHAVSFAVLVDQTAGTAVPVAFPVLGAPHAAVSVGEQVIVFDHADPGGHAFALRPDVDQWEPLPEVRGLDDGRTQIYGGAAVVVDDRYVLYHGGYAHPAFLAFDTHTWGWTVLDAGEARLQAIAGWTGGELLLWGGWTTTGPRADLAVWEAPLELFGTVCEDARPVLAAGADGAADGLVPAGTSTPQQAAELLADPDTTAALREQYGAEGLRVLIRQGEVWQARDDGGHDVLTQPLGSVLVTLPPGARCPAAPALRDGVLLAFVVGDASS